MIYKNKHLKVTDFAHSRFIRERAENNVVTFSDEEHRPVVPREGEGLHFIAPEYIEEGEESFGMDLWALGCIIYFMITGEKPFNGRDFDTVVLNIVRKAIELDGGAAADMSPEAKDLILKLLHTQPDLRLGAGEEGSQQDFSNLKNHEWFNSEKF